jgi:hypothetical protein
MFSAALDPGATRFQPPVPVDLNVGEATATFSSLAMARGGSAYLVYRVVTDTSAANPPGYVGADVKVARYGGALWTVLGSLADRNPGIPVRAPSALNSPRVGIDVGGTSGIVAFHEPGDDFVDRVWARRIFGSASSPAARLASIRSTSSPRPTRISPTSSGRTRTRPTCASRASTRPTTKW